MINEITPLERYDIKGKTVHVKRDDLMGDGVEHPPWGKLTAIREVLTYINPKKPLIHLSVFGSWSGWALAEIAKELDYEFIMAYPESKKFPKQIIEKSEKVLPIKPNMMNGKQNGSSNLFGVFENLILMVMMMISLVLIKILLCLAWVQSLFSNLLKRKNYQMLQQKNLH